jgi:hypothetical protein
VHRSQRACWLDTQEISYITLTVTIMNEPPKQFDITIRVAHEAACPPDPAAFAVAANRVAAAWEASFVSAHTAEEIVCVVSVPAASGPGAAVVALAVVAEALRAGDRVPSPSR